MKVSPTKKIDHFSPERPKPVRVPGRRRLPDLQEPMFQAPDDGHQAGSVQVQRSHGNGFIARGCLA